MYLRTYCESIGTDGIIKKIKETVGDSPVYLSIDVRDFYNLLENVC